MKIKLDSLNEEKSLDELKRLFEELREFFEYSREVDKDVVYIPYYIPPSQETNWYSNQPRCTIVSA